MELRNKGDYMRAVKEMDPRVKEIDSAVPMQTSSVLESLGVDRSMMVMMYWKNGRQEIVNIAAHWAILNNNQ